MQTRYGLSILLFLNGLPGLAHASDPPFATEIPFTSCAGLICLPVILDGQKRTFVLDTGDIDSYVTEDTASALGWKMEPIMDGDGKPVSGVSKAGMHAVQLGTMSFNENILAFPRGDMAPKDVQMPFDGGIVFPAFKDRVVQIDYARHLLRISEVLQGTTEGKRPGVLKTVTFGEKGPAILVGGPFIVNGHALQAQIDTVFSGTMVIYDAAIKKLGLQPIAGRGAIRMFPFTDGGVSMLGTSTKRIEFASHAIGGNSPTIYFATPGVHQPDGLFEGTVGNELFQHSIVTLDFHNMSLSVEPVSD